MTTIYLFHGYGVADKGKGTTDTLRGPFEQMGFTVVEVDYGKTSIFNVRERNERVVRETLPKLKKGDVLVGHSNGCLIIHMLIEAGAPVSKVICIQPALRRDAKWPEGVKVLCTYNKKDYVVRFAGRWWGRFVTRTKPWEERHGWGAAGYFGFDQKSGVTNINIDVPPHPAPYHSGIFKQRSRYLHWGRHFGEWVLNG